MEIIKEFKFGNNIVTYYETYILVSLGYVPSESGGSVLGSYRYNYSECVGLSPKDIIDLSYISLNKEWEEIHEDWDDFDC